MLPIVLEEKSTERLFQGKNISDNIIGMLRDVFTRVHKDLKEGGIANPDFSGATCCVTLFKGRSVFAANAGDSRAILVNS